MLQMFSINLKDLNEHFSILQVPVDGGFTNWGNFSPSSRIEELCPRFSISPKNQR